jgi:pimeloyl-ACP methyl ester carboxylesterase
LKKLKIGFFISLIAWIIFAQSCMFFRTSDIDAAAEFTAKGIAAEVRYEMVEGINMHYVKTGKDDKPTVFFIHGSPGSWDAFKSYLQDSLLLQKFRMVSVDRPGFGYSNFGHALNLDDQSKIIGIIMSKLYNGREFYVVGHSLGGPLCVRLALDHPGNISGMVLLSAAMDPGLEKAESWRKLFMNNPLQWLVPGAMRPSNYELWYLKADLKKLEEDMRGKQLPYIWMMHGDKDGMVPYSNVGFVKNKIDSSRLTVVTLEGANHFIPWTFYDQIRKLLLRLPVADPQDTNISSTPASE